MSNYDWQDIEGDWQKAHTDVIRRDGDHVTVRRKPLIDANPKDWRVRVEEWFWHPQVDVILSMTCTDNALDDTARSLAQAAVIADAAVEGERDEDQMESILYACRMDDERREAISTPADADELPFDSVESGSE